MAPDHHWCLTDGKARWAAAWLAVVIFTGMGIRPLPVGAAQTLCADYSLSRNEVARAMTAARSVLAGSSKLEVTLECWNPDRSLADLATPRTQTPDGAQQWWSVSCQRNESTWSCDRPEFRQFIVGNLVVGDRPRAVELSFGQGITVTRARALASKALTFYEDPAPQLRDCSTIDDSAKSPVGSHRNDKQRNAADPLHANVIRDGTTDDVWLDDDGVIIAFDAADERSACWRDIVTAN